MDLSNNNNRPEDKNVLEENNPRNPRIVLFLLKGENLAEYEDEPFSKDNFRFWDNEKIGRSLVHIAKYCSSLVEYIDKSSNHEDVIEEDEIFDDKDSVDLYTVMEDLFQKSRILSSPQQQRKTHVTSSSEFSQKECSFLPPEHQKEMRVEKHEMSETSLAHQPEDDQKRQIVEPQHSLSKPDEPHYETTFNDQQWQISDDPLQSNYKIPINDHAIQTSASAEAENSTREYITIKVEIINPDLPVPVSDQKKCTASPQMPHDIKQHTAIDTLSTNSECHSEPSTSKDLQLQTSNASLQPNNPSSENNRQECLPAHKNNRYQCDECDKKFKTEGGFNQHNDWVHKDRIHRCIQCGKKFSTEKLLNKHILKHASANKPYKCDSCEKAYYHGSDLYRHRQSHNAAGKSYKCTMCTKDFSRSDHLDKHLRSHERKARKSSAKKNKQCLS